MAEGIVYLDVDDEITSAAQRIRSAAGTRVALVVPYGSRIATSRMNFRLLSREAVMNNRRLSIVSGDAAARSLAASAGLPVFGSIAEYESSLSGPAPASTGDAGGAALGDDAAGNPTGPAATAADTAAAAGTAAAAAASPIAATLAASETVVIPPEVPAKPGTRRSQRPKRPPPDATPTTAPVVAGGAATAGAAGVSGAMASPPVAGPYTSDRDPEPDRAADPSLPAILGGRIRAPVVAAIGLVGLAVVVVAVAAYLFLPAATVAITPRRDVVGPIQLTVSADPEATTVDVANAIVPAVRVDVSVEATRTFTTTGTHVEEAAARGSVTFTNYDTSSGVSIPSGSSVSTEGGVRFRTQRTVVLQPASIFPAFEPSSGSVQVVAAKTGEAGNVPANTIRVVPASKDPVLLRVNNPAETSGGTHTETPEITQPEIDKAMAALQKDLQVAFDEMIASGTSAPADTTLFPDTALLGPATPDIDPATLVGKPDPTFDLRLTANGTVIAVDPRPVQSIAEAQLASLVTANHRLVDGSADIDVGAGTVGEDSEVTFQATARATQVAIVDASAIPALVKGKTAAEAKAALAAFGDATVTLWPDWVSTVTSVDARLNVTIDESAEPSGSPPPSGSPRPSRTPAGSGSAPSVPPGSAGASSGTGASPSASP
jgi:hypothetical protein